MDIDIRFDRQAFDQGADKIVRTDIPKANKIAFDDVAADVVARLRAKMAEKIDRPTDQVLNSLYADVQGRSDPSLSVGVSPEQTEFFESLFEGGTRSDVLVPTDSTPLDAHGNWPGGAAAYINSVESAGGFWRISRSGVPSLFQQTADGAEAVAMVVDSVSWEPVMDFQAEATALLSDLVPDAVRKAFNAVFNR